MVDISGLSAVLTAGSAILTTMGGGIAFVWRKVERNHRDVSARLETIRQSLDKCKGERGVQTTCIELLWAELARHNPATPVFDRVKKLLEDLKRED
jgi:hypothetical protein